MFYWKSAIVLVGIVVLLYPVAMAMARSNWERMQTQKLMLAAAAISCLTVSAVPILVTPILFAIMLLLCIDHRAPASAPFLMFIVWTPMASGLLELVGLYLMPLTPPLVFGATMVVAFALNPRVKLRPGVHRTDVYLAMFLTAFWICVSLRDGITIAMRNAFIYAVPYGLAYWGVSRTRIERPELALRWLVIGAAMAGVVCLFETIRSWPLYSGLYAIKRANNLVQYNDMMLLRAGVLRSSGPFVHPLVGSVVFGMAGVAAAGLAALRGLRWPIVLLGAAIVIGMLVTVSRSGLVALVVGLIALLALRGRPLTALGFLGLGLAGFFLLQFISGSDGSSTAAYRFTMLSGIPATLGSRLILGYREAIGLGLLDAFMQGQGLVDLVNVYLAIAVVGGLVSLLPYVVFLFSSFGQYRALRRAKPTHEQLVVGQTCVAMQIGYMVAAAFLGAWSTPMLLSMLCAALLVALRTEAEQAPKRAAAAARQATRQQDPFLLPALQ
ncbi:hypothetical protein [Sphingomonas crocodyli]|uniref:O-antigen ligase domain-containing protein n=1 Tax=Sphingomonas crocodyli TaxID=1979270 RepID=A0A437MB63_9SPHN|nr:hypothetical protein [Sphingomonas crocodyli]RVT94868.1 hypothetical protein EOD43_13975 [Sphingomonas crocodyli]